MAVRSKEYNLDRYAPAVVVTTTADAAPNTNPTTSLARGVFIVGNDGSVDGGYIAPVTITRPANTTAYSAVDVVGGVLTISAAGPASSTSMLTGTRLELDIAAVPTGMTYFTLHLYSATPPSAYADNAAWDLPSGDRSVYMGNAILGTPVDLGSTLYVEANQINKLMKLVGGSTLYGYLVTATGYTPAAVSEVYKLTVCSVAI